jgi:hypothetical protein
MGCFRPRMTIEQVRPLCEMYSRESASVGPSCRMASSTALPTSSLPSSSDPSCSKIASLSFSELYNIQKEINKKINLGITNRDRWNSTMGQTTQNNILAANGLGSLQSYYKTYYKLNVSFVLGFLQQNNRLCDPCGCSW